MTLIFTLTLGYSASKAALYAFSDFSSSPCGYVQMLSSPVRSGGAVGATEPPASALAAGVGGGGAVTAGPSDAVPPRGPHAPRTSPSTAAPATARSHVLLRMWVISSPAPLVPRRFHFRPAARP